MRHFVLGVLTALLAAAVLALAILFTGRMPVGAADPPPGWERSIAKRAFDAAVARQATQRANPVPSSEAELLAGLKLYRDNCAGCHGEGNSPSTWGAQFYPRVPQFGSEPPRKQAWQIFWIVENGVRYSGMGGWKGQMPEADVWRLSAFLSRLDSLPPAVSAAWKPPASK